MGVSSTPFNFAGAGGTLHVASLPARWQPTLKDLLFEYQTCWNWHALLFLSTAACLCSRLLFSHRAARPQPLLYVIFTPSWLAW